MPHYLRYLVSFPLAWIVPTAANAANPPPAYDGISACYWKIQHAHRSLVSGKGSGGAQDYVADPKGKYVLIKTSALGGREGFLLLAGNSATIYRLDNGDQIEKGRLAYKNRPPSSDPGGPETAPSFARCSLVDSSVGRVDFNYDLYENGGIRGFVGNAPAVPCKLRSDGSVDARIVENFLRDDLSRRLADVAPKYKSEREQWESERYGERQKKNVAHIQRIEEVKNLIAKTKGNERKFWEKELNGSQEYLNRITVGPQRNDFSGPVTSCSTLVEDPQIKKSISTALEDLAKLPSGESPGGGSDPSSGTAKGRQGK